MTVYFPDTTLHRYTITTTSGGVYGETVQEYTYTDDILVDFQNESNQEIAHQYGEELSDLYKIYTDISTPLNSSDKLVDSNGTEYVLVGDVQVYPKFHHYKKAHLARRR